jgi:hypothetical protein
VPFYAKLPALDMLGLSDAFLARHRPADFGRGALAHELGNGDYVLSREPDLVLFCLPAGGSEPCFRSGVEMLRDPRFGERYRLVQLEGRTPHVFRSRLWARAEGGRIGIRREPGRVTVPAWFATDAPGSAASLGAASRLVVEVSAQTPAGIAGLRLAPGRWELTALGVGSVPRVSVDTGGAWRTQARSVAFELAAQGDASVDVLVGLADAEGRFALEELRFERAPLDVQDRDPGDQHEEQSQAQPVAVHEGE